MGCLSDSQQHWLRCVRSKGAEGLTAGPTQRTLRALEKAGLIRFQALPDRVLVGKWFLV